MSPLDFIWSEQPFFPMSEDAALIAGECVSAADHAARALIGALREALGLEGSEGSTLDAVRETFFQATQSAFEQTLRRILNGEEEAAIKQAWLKGLTRQAEMQFNAIALPGLAQRDITPKDNSGFSRRPTVARIVAAQKQLAGSLRGKKMREALKIPQPINEGQPA